jgi:SAM-dependent methyltransferase
MVSPLGLNIHKELSRLLEATPEPAVLNQILRLMGKWRSVLVQNSWIQHQGTVVASGLLAGMDFVAQASEGCLLAKLIGCYEQPLQGVLAHIIKRPYARVLNIGCADGYYSVGLARLMPQTQIEAFDINPKAQEACRALAAKNRVEGQVTVKGGFEATDFARYKGLPLLVFCDIEGAEDALLDPVQSPALTGFDLIIESHECFLPGLSQRLIQRFAASHNITQINDTGSRQLPPNMPSWFTGLSHMDQLLALWEWRTGPTPWLVMEAKARP